MRNVFFICAFQSFAIAIYSYFIDFEGVICETMKLGPRRAKRQATNVITFMAIIAGIFISTGT